MTIGRVISEDVTDHIPDGTRRRLGALFFVYETLPKKLKFQRSKVNQTRKCHDILLNQAEYFMAYLVLLHKMLCDVPGMVTAFVLGNHTGPSTQMMTGGVPHFPRSSSPFYS